MYDCTCSTCNHKTESLTLDLKDVFKPLLKSIETAFKTLHKNGNYKPEDLNTVEAYKDVIHQTNKILSSSITDNDLSDEMVKRLEKDVFIFSGLKTNAQLFEASRQLLTEDKKIKSFDLFRNDVQGVAKSHQKYLEAEYDFAVGSMQMVDKWESFNNSDRYMLQYRTAADNRVRDTHQALHNITLKKTDPFWDMFFPPNGWRCRCTTVEVLARLNTESDSKKSIENGNAATTKIGKSGKNKLEIFRFNAGKQQKVFPPKHPYNKVKGASTVKKTIAQKIKEDTAPKEPKYTPENLGSYEKKLKVKINREIFSFLKKKVPLIHNNKGTRVKSKGAYFSPSEGLVHIPINKRRKDSKWGAESIYYHEYGHAADWHNDIRANKKVSTLMSKYRKEFAKDKSKKFITLHNNILTKNREAWAKQDHDALEKITATADTLMSLNSKFGYGHTKVYFSKKGKKEAEFIAHAFENKFIGNDVFKELMPELYDEMITLIDGFKPK